jgi:putative MFS transporter
VLDAFDDEVRATPARRRALLAIGLGEFVDGYDLIVISGALLQLQLRFHMSKGDVGWLSAAAFFGSAVGAVCFGDLTDRLGRRRIFVLNLMAFVGLAVLSAAITQLWMLFAVRVLIGVAIGADIVASMAFLSELSPRRSRGSWTGAMPQITWSLGAICAVLVDAALYVVGGSEAWRLMFLAAALPALGVLFLRRSLPDSPRWLLSRGRVDEAITSFAQFGIPRADAQAMITALPTSRPTGARPRLQFRDCLAPYATIFKDGRRAAGVFAIVMIGVIPLNGIGQSVLGPYVLKEFGHLTPVGALLGGAVIWLGALVGSVLAWQTIDRVGRARLISIALVGFVVVYGLMVSVAARTVMLVPLFCLLGVVTWLGASACWPLPSEMAPTEVRGRAQGLGSGLQRASVGINVLIVPQLLGALGFRWTVVIAAGVSALLRPYALLGRRYEPARRSLELASVDDLLSDGVTRTATVVAERIPSLASP